MIQPVIQSAPQTDHVQGISVFLYLFHFSAKSWGTGDRSVSAETFDRHFNDTKNSRESSIDSHDWRPKYVGDIVTTSSGYRHSFSEPILVGNAAKKVKTGTQSTLQSKFHKILRDYSKFIPNFIA